MLIAAGRSSARVPTCEQTLRDCRTAYYHLVAADNEDWFLADRLRHDLKFEEWQDDYDANTLALGEMGLRTARVDDFTPVLVRALSLFGPGELRALRVLDVDSFRLIASQMRENEASATRGVGAAAPHLEQAMEGLCAVHAGASFSPSPDVGSLAAVLERHAPTITELHVALPVRMLELSSALARCTRLGTLTSAYTHDPAVWLGLSQLHTLRGVDLGEVSFAAIAAALPKLHTLKAAGYCDDPAHAAAFFTDLLPRLQMFHFEGNWPEAQQAEPPATITPNVAPLPLLKDLLWAAASDIAPREFLGAQPTVLHAPYALISQCWSGGGAADASADFLARVNDLLITPALIDDPLVLTDVARMLRAAPHMKRFHAVHCVQGDASWLAPTATSHPAFEGLVHPRLRKFGIVTRGREAAKRTSENTPSDGWAAHLRRRHFPRLRELAVGKSAYFVTPPDCVVWETGAAA
jgi:hypothetical protein